MFFSGYGGWPGTVSVSLSSFMATSKLKFAAVRSISQLPVRITSRRSRGCFTAFGSPTKFFQIVFIAMEPSDGLSHS